MRHTLPLFLLALALTQPATAEMNHAEHAGDMNHAGMNAMQSDGVVRKMDKRQGKLTLRHGPLENLDMPAMTMVFRVTKSEWLDQINPGDKVRFVAERVKGQLTVTSINIVH